MLGLLTSPMFELLGLAWHTIAASGVTLFWQTLVSSGAWTDLAMSFQLTQCVLYMCIVSCAHRGWWVLL